MKKTNLLKLLHITMCVLISICAKSQVLDVSIKNNYPASIVERVYKIAVKVPINPSRQTAFANYFQRKDSILANVIKGNATDDSVRAITNQQDSLFETMFTPTERFTYFTETNQKKARSKPITFSQFSLAVKYKDSLSLDSVIVTTLLTKITELRKLRDDYYKANNGKYYDSRAFESSTMTDLLTEEQYTKLLTIKNTEKAKNNALNDWNELVQRNLDSTFIQDSTIKDLSKFHLARCIAYDRFAHDKLKLNDVVKAIYDAKPKAYMVLQHARRNPDNDTIGQSFQW